MKNAGGFILGSLLYSPILVFEDGLREVGVDVPKEGIARNHKGQSIGDIWNESVAEVEAKKIERVNAEELERATREIENE